MPPESVSEAAWFWDVLGVGDWWFRVCGLAFGVRVSSIGKPTGVNGWFNYDFCCLEPAPEHENCDWNFLLSRVGEDVQPLENYPVILREALG